MKSSSLLTPVVYGRPEVLVFDCLKLDRAEALRYLGHIDQEMDDALQERFEKLAAACEQQLRPACVYATFKVAQVGEVAACGCMPSIALEGSGLKLLGCDIVSHVAQANEVILLACTLGANSVRELAKYEALSMVDALLFNAAASALIEAALRKVQTAIEQSANQRNLYATTRFSPGYGDFPLSLQPQLLEALDAARRIGLRVNEASMLLPEKSVTAVIGLIKPEYDCGKRGQCRQAEQCVTCVLRERCPIKSSGGMCHE